MLKVFNFNIRANYNSVLHKYINLNITNSPYFAPGISSSNVVKI